MEELEIRAATADDTPAIVSALRTLLGPQAPPAEELSARRRWGYDENPAGARSFIALDGADVVAHYGALAAPALLGGQQLVLSQPVDSFALSAWRGRGVFVATARAFFEAHGGRDDQAYYGWPVAAAWSAGRKYLGYQALRTQLALVAETPAGPSSWPQGVVELREFGPEVRWLFERCARHFATAIVRDAARLDWRLRARPGGVYRCLGARDAEGVLRGLAVVASADQLAPGAAALVEWMVPEDEPEVGELLARAACAAAAASGARALLAWLPPWSGWFTRLQTCGFRVFATPYVLAARSFTRRLDADLLREGWWYTMADSDLV